MLLSSRDEQADAQGNFTGMSDDQVRDEVLTIFLAGYETVANGLTWTWYLLSQNPEVEAKLHAELDVVLGTGADRRSATLADYANLKYTEQIFAESMRLYPPAWAMGRMSTKPVKLGEYLIPSGAHFFFSQYLLGRSEEYFPDPLRFDPDRFSAENKAKRPKFTYFPFWRRERAVHRRVVRLDGRRLLDCNPGSALAAELRRKRSAGGAGEDHIAAARSANDEAASTLKLLFCAIYWRWQAKRSCGACRCGPWGRRRREATGRSSSYRHLCRPAGWG